MTYRVEFRRDGAVIGEAEGLEDRTAAKRVAEAEIARRDAEIALVIDVDGTGMEVVKHSVHPPMWRIVSLDCYEREQETFIKRY